MHAIDRALERYNKEYTFQDIKNIRQNIKNGKIVGRAFKPRSNKSENMLVYTMYNHIPLKVLYSPITYNVITMFPFDFDEFNKLQNMK